LGQIKANLDPVGASRGKAPPLGFTVGSATEFWIGAKQYRVVRDDPMLFGTRGLGAMLPPRSRILSRV